MYISTPPEQPARSLIALTQTDVLMVLSPSRPGTGYLSTDQGVSDFSQNVCGFHSRGLEYLFSKHSLGI